MNLFRQDHENIGPVGLTLGGLRLPWLGSRVSVPSQKLRSGPGGESAKSEPLDQWPVTRPGPLRFVEKNPTKTEISETQVKRLLGGREYSTCGQTRGQAQRHSCPRGSLNHLCGAFPLGFLWPVILLCRVLSLCWVYLSVFPAGFPGGSVVENPPAVWDTRVQSPGLGRSPGGGNGHPLQYSCQGHPLDRGAWWTTYSPAAAAAATLLQSCPTLCDPIDGSPPGSPVPGILQARTLEWVAISFSNA